MSDRDSSATGPSSLDYDFRTDESAAVVVLDGDVDLANTSDIEHGIERILATNDVDTLVLDLAAVDFMDSTGLRMLWGVRQMAQDAEARFVIRDPSHAVTRLLKLTGMHRIFQVEAEEAN